MPGVVFRNRLDPDNPLYARPGRGQLGHTGRLPAVSVVNPGGGTGNLFTSSWEFATGCSVNALLDGSPGTKWDEGGGMDCTGRSGQPVTEITTAQSADGSNSCRVWQMPWGGAPPVPPDFNGTDFRVQKTFALHSTGTVLYVRWYIRWGNNWHFASGDHKMVIFGNSVALSQDLYFNIRSGGRFTIGNQTANGVWCDNRPAMAFQNNTWYRLEARIQFGFNGSIQTRQNGVANVWTAEDVSQHANVENHPVGMVGSSSTPRGYNFVKMDSTYNIGSSITEPMDQYWDKFGLGNQDWIGP